MDLPGAVEVALDGGRRPLDVGVLNGERFAVMAGAGFDAALMQDTNRALKDRLGRLAYVWSGARAVRSKPVKMHIEIDGRPWFDGRASCLLLGNFGTITGKLTVFASAEPDDGLLEVAVVTASNSIQWARVLTALAAGRADRSRFVHKGRGHRITVKLGRPIAYELDGGARKATKRLHAGVEAGAITVCVAEDGRTVSTASLVPETFDLSGDDAWTTLSRVGKRRLLTDAFMRMRVADGFSHARSLAFMTTLVAVQGVIGLVGLASLFDKGSIGTMVVATVRRAVPGAAGQVLASAVVQAHTTAAEHRYSALVFGLVGSLVTGTTVMGQVERGLNRLYGVERDRPTIQKYGLALVFAVSAGTLVALAFGCLAFGREIFHTSNSAPQHGVGDRALAAGPGADRGGGDAAVPVVAAPPATPAVLAVLRRRGVGAALGCRHDRPGRVLPVQLVVWPDLRSARRPHRPSPVVPAVGHGAVVRGGGGGPAGVGPGRRGGAPGRREGGRVRAGRRSDTGAGRVVTATSRMAAMVGRRTRRANAC